MSTPDVLKRSKEEYVLITLCVAGVTGIFPFALLRILKGDALLAAIDSALVAGVFLIGLHVWRTREVRFPGIMLTLFYMSGMVAVVYVSDAALVYWAFPTMTAAYFLIRPGEAVFINILAMVAILPSIVTHMETLQVSSVLVTLSLNNIFSYIFARNSQLQHQELALLATRDGLTGAGNRRLFDEIVLECVALRERSETPASLIMLDIDHFKKINDEFGHAAGDEVLIGLIELLRRRLRKGDGIYRIGGEEFAVIAHRCGLEVACRLAEELRCLVEQGELLPQQPVTVSIGVAECCVGDTDKSWVERADAALYRAKNSGRNKTEKSTLESDRGC